MLEYNRGIEEALNNICAPLIDNLGMNLFYAKKYKDNKQFILMDNHGFLKEMFRMGPDLVGSVYAKQMPILSKDFKFALWTSCVNFKDNSINSPYTRALWYHGCRMGINVVKENNGEEEIAGFMPIDYIKDFEYFCIRNYDLFVRFTKYFFTKAGDLININTKKLTLLGYTTKLDYNSEDETLKNEKERIKNFIDAVGMTVKAKNGNIVTMSKQEIKFLHLLSEGNSIKEIATALDIAPKTSENHMYKIKVKTGYTIKSDLVKLYLNQGS